MSSFYEFHGRHGAGVGDLLARWRPGGRGGSWRPFLAHLGDRPERRRVIALRSERRLPRELTVDTYSHLGMEDARRALVAAGVLAEVRS